MPPKISVNNKAEIPELYVLDDIGPSWLGMVGAKDFSRELANLRKEKEIDVRINSAGGMVFEGFAIYNLLKDHPAKINMKIDGYAASIASVVAMAGDTITLGENAFLMIHDPWMIAAGTASEFRSQADTLDQLRDKIASVYASRSGRDATEFAAMMAEETWIDADRAVELGLADTIEPNKAIVNSIRPRGFAFNSIPDSIMQSASLGALLNAAIRDIEEDQNDVRSRSMVLDDLSRLSLVAPDDLFDILDGRAGCQSETTLDTFAKYLQLDGDAVRNAAVSDGCRIVDKNSDACRCKQPPSDTADTETESTDEKPLLDKWKATPIGA